MRKMHGFYNTKKNESLKKKVNSILTMKELVYYEQHTKNI